MVTRLKNFSSVFCWSLGSCGPLGYGVLKELIRSLDDTRAINCEGDVRFIASDFFSASDCSPEALLRVSAHKRIPGNNFFSFNGLSFTNYVNNALLLCEVDSSIDSLQEKIVIAQNSDRILGLFVDMGSSESYAPLKAAFNISKKNVEGKSQNDE